MSVASTESRLFELVRSQRAVVAPLVRGNVHETWIDMTLGRYYYQSVPNGNGWLGPLSADAQTGYIVVPPGESVVCHTHEFVAALRPYSILFASADAGAVLIGSGEGQYIPLRISNPHPVNSMRIRAGSVVGRIMFFRAAMRKEQLPSDDLYESLHAAQMKRMASWKPSDVLPVALARMFVPPSDVGQYVRGAAARTENYAPQVVTDADGAAEAGKAGPTGSGTGEEESPEEGEHPSAHATPNYHVLAEYAPTAPYHVSGASAWTMQQPQPQPPPMQQQYYDPNQYAQHPQQPWGYGLQRQPDPPIDPRGIPPPAPMPARYQQQQQQYQR